MNIATWGEQTNRFLQEDVFHSSILHFWVGAAPVGSVIWYQPEGPYYAMSQVRRFGAYADLDYAKGIVETWALYDAVTYPTCGNA